MPLSWTEIRHRAIAFSREWQGETREAAERQSFWNDFFNVFGVRRRTVATFEEPVKKLSGDWGFIGLFWPSTSPPARALTKPTPRASARPDEAEVLPHRGWMCPANRVMLLWWLPCLAGARLRVSGEASAMPGGVGVVCSKCPSARPLS